MGRYITIDGGTTNTRLFLVENKKILKTVKLSIGSKDNIEANSALKTAIKENIKELLSEFNLKDDDITAIIASGMITSEYGLYEIKHTVAPAGVEELHNFMQRVYLDDISPIPFYFISGVIIKGKDFKDTDMMRGEETEIIGLLKEEYTDYAYLLPGSHSKLISLDSNGRITDCKTMMSGEMLSALSQNTILRGSVSLCFEDYNFEYLEAGYDACVEMGINQAVFKTRILRNIFGLNDIDCYSYFLGVILAHEIKTIINCGKKGVVIGGKDALKNPISHLLKCKSKLDIIVIPNEITDNCTSIGAVKIFEYKKSKP